MVRIFIEICMISAHGLSRQSSFWKLQWFAVGWIDPNNKYCSKIDSSGSTNPTWKTKFSVSMNDGELDPQSLMLTVEVHSREPVFLREKLHGTVRIPLKEFVTKFANDPNGWRSGFEEVGSFQLRGKNSGKPRGFIDVSVRISEKRIEDTTGSNKASQFPEIRSGISLAIEDGDELTYSARDRSRTDGPVGNHNSENYHHDLAYSSRLSNKVGSSGSQIGSSTPTKNPYEQEMLPWQNHKKYEEHTTGNGRPQAPPPPPPPSNTGFIPTFFPPSGQLPGSYINLPPSRTGVQSTEHVGFATGAGAGALAAGAVIFGDDFLSNSNFPTSFEGGTTLGLSIDSPF